MRWVQDFNPDFIFHGIGLCISGFFIFMFIYGCVFDLGGYITDTIIFNIFVDTFFFDELRYLRRGPS